MFPGPIQKARPFARGAYIFSVYVVLLVWLLPAIAILMTSARSEADILSANFWGKYTDFALFENYTEVFNPDRSPMALYFRNSFIITLPAVFFSMFFSSLAGYSLAIHQFRGRLLLYAVFIAGNFVPFQMLMIPVRTLFGSLGLIDTMAALIIFHSSFQIGFATFFLRNFIVGLPVSFIESARIEGASELRIFFHIVVPLIRPALASLGVLLFTFIWNDFFWALTLVQSDAVRPVTFGLQALKGQWVAAWNLISAGSVVAALPPVIVFIVLQRQFVSGLVFGGVKE